MRLIETDLSSHCDRSKSSPFNWCVITPFCGVLHPHANSDGCFVKCCENLLNTFFFLELKYCGPLGIHREENIVNFSVLKPNNHYQTFMLLCNLFTDVETRVIVLQVTKQAAHCKENLYLCRKN